MKILSVNAGSSSLKFSLFELPEERELINGYFERIGMGNSFYSIKINGEKIKREVEIKDVNEAIDYLKRELIENNVISSLDEIDGIGHRVVHGGDVYSASEVINDELINKCEVLSELAPLHNPANISGIKAFMESLPGVSNIAVFDTAFHQTINKVQYLYPVPYEWYENYGIRKYGFHGTSYKYIDKKMSEYLKRDNLKLVVCHLGSGASVCAIDSHKSIDTSLGFTPLPGVMMGTRSGDVDPSIIPYVMEKENKSINDVISDLNKKSGYLGVSGISNDNRDIEVAAEEGNERAKLAFEMFNQRVANYVAMYNNLLDGADAICFTAGIGEKGQDTRADIINRLSSLGVNVDNMRNKAFGEFALISTDDSKIPVYVVPTNEELMIALDTYNLIK